MQRDGEASRVGLLLSGGLDSGILLGSLLRQGRRVRPFYVRSHLFWEAAELRALRRYIKALGRVSGWSELLEELVVLDLPVQDLYADHWSVTGQEPPGQDSSDDAVYLPGRNLLLLTKVAIWCQLHGLDRLALGVLGTNPFADATSDFFEELQGAINRALGGRLEILRPLAGLNKPEVMKLGRGLPLRWTFSCIAPVRGRHCGRCNKCAERQAAFRAADLADPTRYATPLLVP